MKKADLKLWLWCLTATSLPCTLFAQQAPVPDPISTPAATVEKQKCKCDLKALTADELASVGPVSSFGDDTKSVMSPSGFTRPNPKDEWSGEDVKFPMNSGRLTESVFSQEGSPDGQFQSFFIVAAACASYIYR